jgi:hypothetical protein
MTMFETLGRTMRASTDTLKIQCNACGRRRTFTRAEAFAHFGPGAAPYDVRRRCRCSACKRSGYVTVWI